MMLIQTLSVRGTFALVLAGLLFASSAAVAQQAIPRDLSVEQVPIAEIGEGEEAPDSDIKVDAWVDHKDEIYSPGDTLQLYVKASRDTYITVLDVGTSGKVHVIFPNEFQHENKVAAQEVVQIPPEDGRFQFRVKGPAGREVLKVFATERPLECLDPQRLAKSGPYYEVPGEPKAIARDISVELKRNLKAIYGVATRFVTIRANGAKSSMLDQRRLPSSAETPEHLFELGEASLYDDRQASLRDARRYYEQAAGHGHVLSMVRLGEIYEGGLGTEPDAVKALHWYRTAAELGSAAAMVKLGHMYELGLGVEASPAEALNWLSKAAKAGDGVAMARLARAYDEGKGVEQNAREAARYALAAVRAGVWSPQRDIPRFNEETRVEVQRQLRNAGFYHGRLDGTFGPETRAALVEYARAEHVAG